jgi:hypothetical protein
MEMLAVLTVVAILLAAAASTPRLLSTNRRVAALHELVSAFDAARAHAMRDNAPVYVAFVTKPTSGSLEPLRQYALFEENTDVNGAAAMKQLSDWHMLADGVLLDPAALTTGFNNLLSLSTALRDVPLGKAGADMVTPLHCLAFGPQGDVIFPTEPASPYTLVIAEGILSADKSSVQNAKARQALEIHRSTGRTFLQP